MSPDELVLEVQRLQPQEGDLIVVTIAQDIDMGSASRMRQVLLDALPAGVRAIVVEEPSKVECIHHHDCPEAPVDLAFVRLAHVSGEVSNWRCPRCGSSRWVSTSLNEGWTRIPQCVPCGHYDTTTTLGPGWRKLHESAKARNRAENRA